jgi:hypothetical protein
MLVLPLPRVWVALVALGVVLSTIQIATGGRDGTAFSFHVTTVTAFLIALVWLPPLIKVIVLAGVTLKGPGGEATTSGLFGILRLLDPEAQENALPPLIVGLQNAEERAPFPEQTTIKDIRLGLESQLASLPVDAQVARKRLAELAAEYERTRESMPTGQERTFAMQRIVTEARALGPRAVLSPKELSDFFAASDEGGRIVALAILQAVAKPEFFALVKDSIAHSRSAFEQYQALRATEALLPLLSEGDKQTLKRILLDQRGGGDKKWIVPGTNRWVLSDHILATLRQT